MARTYHALGVELNEAWRIGAARCQLAATGPYQISGLGLRFVMVVMAVVMVLPGRGTRRRSNHHNEQGGEQKLLHASIVAPVFMRKHTTLGEEVENANQRSEH